MSSFVFDLDGTLADTEELLRAAYLRAGVNATSEELRLPHGQWLPDIVGPAATQHVYQRKQVEYQRLLSERGVRGLPALNLLKELHGRKDVVAVVTATSKQTAFRVLDMIHAPKVPLLGFRTPPEARPSLLQQLDRTGGLYFDDRLETCHIVGNSSWDAVHITEDTTLDSLRDRVKTWRSHRNSK